MPSLVHGIVEDYAARRLRKREMAALRQWKLAQVRHQIALPTPPRGDQDHQTAAASGAQEGLSGDKSQLLNFSTPPNEALKPVATSSVDIERFLPIQNHRPRGAQLFPETSLFEIPSQEGKRQREAARQEMAGKDGVEQRRKTMEVGGKKGRPWLPARGSSLSEDDRLMRMMMEKVDLARHQVAPSPRRGSECSQLTLV